ncbi:MAG TPA: TIGR02530 family flagellar biosynthesis protein [Gaiellaceae bacterium]|nr:TIGR02530 family flagellar biosynthesis protein [Gaiellaceae bacterium]
MPEPAGLGPAGPAPARNNRGLTPGVAVRPGEGFAGVLAGKLGSAPVRLSGHALQRAEQRGIPLDPATMARLGDGLSRAAAKGARSSLVLVDGTGFVVSVPNRTVITAVDRDHMREQVFTNIDSAVIA